MARTLPNKEDRKIAFVVVDAQRKFTGGLIPENGNKDSIGTINKAAAMFRDSGRPVIFVHYDGPCENSKYTKDDGDEYLHGIVSDPRDITVHKSRHLDSFLETKLAYVVKECGCDSILLSGLVTQFCVMGTYFGAFGHKISPYMLRGGLISTDEKFNDAACVLCKMFTMEDVEANLRKTKVPGSTKLNGMEYQRL